MPSKSNLIPAIVLSAHTSGLGVIRSLGINNVPVIAVYYEDHDMGVVSKYLKEAFHAPHPENDSPGFMFLMKKIYEKYGRSVLIPADDATLMFVSKNKEILSKWFIPSATDFYITRLYIEKKYTYSLAEKAGVPVPKTIIPESIEAVMKYSSEVMYPILIKPSQSHRYYDIFKKKMHTAHDRYELIEIYEQAAGYNLEVMLQELIPGDLIGYNYNSLFIDNEPKVEFMSEKVRYSPDNFGVPCAVKSCSFIPEILESGRKILKAMCFNGFSCSEFKQDPRDGLYKLMEVNGRHNRSALCAVQAGINFPWLLYKYEVNGEIPVQTDYKKNLYWIDESRDIMSTLPKALLLKYPFREFIRPYTSSHVFAVYNNKDFHPFKKRLSDIFKMAIGKNNKKNELVQVKAAGVR